MPKPTIQQLVEAFAENVVGQNEAAMRGDASTGNKHAREYIAVWHSLCERGDEGRDALMVLLGHPRPDVQAVAACYLLRHSTKESLRVLKQVAKKRGLAGFEAAECIKRWQEGTWQLDVTAGRTAAEIRGKPSRSQLPMPGDVRAILQRLPREILWMDIVDFDRFQERYDVADGLHPGTIGVNQGSVEWTPSQEPPGMEETLAWWWLVRPDLGVAIAGEADDVLAAAIANYVVDSTLADT